MYACAVGENLLLVEAPGESLEKLVLTEGPRLKLAMRCYYIRTSEDAREQGRRHVRQMPELMDMYQVCGLNLPHKFPCQVQRCGDSELGYGGTATLHDLSSR